jgi:hypothetical protein
VLPHAVRGSGTFNGIALTVTFCVVFFSLSGSFQRVMYLLGQKESEVSESKVQQRIFPAFNLFLSL